MFKSPLKLKSIRKELTGKKVKIKSHAGPALRGRTGKVIDVINNAKNVVIRLDRLPHTARWLHTITMDIKGLELV